MKTLQAYEVTKGSTDGTFLVGDIIWESRDGSIVIACKNGGWINPDELIGETADFQMIESKDYSVVFNGRSEQLVKRER